MCDQGPAPAPHCAPQAAQRRRGALGELLAQHRLVFGLGRIHHLQTVSARQRLIRTALEIGFDEFDVAPAYGNGLAEWELGDALRATGSKAKVTTKAGIPVRVYPRIARHAFRTFRFCDTITGGGPRAYRKREFQPQALAASMERSLKRLSVDSLETFFLHEPLVPFDPALKENVSALLERFRAAGRIRHWGVAGPRLRPDRGEEWPMGDRVQVPIEEWQSARGWPTAVTVYGVFRAAKRANQPMPAYVAQQALRDGTSRFILATTDISRLQEWFRDQQ